MSKMRRWGYSCFGQETSSPPELSDSEDLVIWSLCNLLSRGKEGPPRISPWRLDKNRDFWRKATSSDTSNPNTDGKYRVKICQMSHKSGERPVTGDRWPSFPPWTFNIQCSTFNLNNAAEGRSLARNEALVGIGTWESIYPMSQSSTCFNRYTRQDRIAHLYL